MPKDEVKLSDKPKPVRKHVEILARIFAPGRTEHQLVQYEPKTIVKNPSAALLAFAEKSRHCHVFDAPEFEK